MARAFALSSLLRLRGLAQDRAAAELATARRARVAAAQDVDRTAGALAGAAMPAAGDGHMWHAAVAGRVALGSLLVERRLELTAMEGEEERFAAVWTRARRDTRAIERLAERHEEAVRLEDLRTEQLVLDEIAGQLTARAAAAGTATEVSP